MVKLWSLAPADLDEVATFKLLAILTFREQAVNCMRWVIHGRYLASAGLVYQYLWCEVLLAWKYNCSKWTSARSVRARQSDSVVLLPPCTVR
jgi:hypothetical protein